MTDLLPLALLAVGLIVLDLTVVACGRYLKYRDARVRDEAYAAVARVIDTTNTELARMLTVQRAGVVARSSYDVTGRQN